MKASTELSVRATPVALTPGGAAAAPQLEADGQPAGSRGDVYCINDDGDVHEMD